MNEIFLERLSITLSIMGVIISSLSLLSTIFLSSSIQSRRELKMFHDMRLFEAEGQKTSIRNTSVLYLAIKRTIDILIGLVLMVLTAIVFIYVAPIIYIQDPGPIFYRQKIIGLRGRNVFVYKLRSFSMDSFNAKEEKQLRIRKYFRREDIFLLPIAFSLLKGDVSLVGLSQHSPGTISEEHMKLYQYEKPGLVYLKMVKEKLDTENTMSDYMYDYHYLNSRSIAFDWKMLTYAFINVALSDL